jgi:hypothetical protein
MNMFRDYGEFWDKESDEREGSTKEDSSKL